MVLAAGKRFAPVVPWTLVVLVAAIAASALLDLEDHGVAVVGDLPSALPDPALPGVGAGDSVNLLALAGGASQTAAAEGAGGRTQLATLIAGVLVLLTGAFLTALFEPLPEATLAAIVIVAVAGFLRVDELARFARLRVGAVVWAGLALAGVLVLGVLEGSWSRPC